MRFGFQSQPGFTSHSDQQFIAAVGACDRFNPNRASQVIPTQSLSRWESNSEINRFNPNRASQVIPTNHALALPMRFNLFQSQPGFTSHSDAESQHRQSRHRHCFNPNRASQVIPTSAACPDPASLPVSIPTGLHKSFPPELGKCTGS